MIKAIVSDCFGVLVFSGHEYMIRDFNLLKNPVFVETQKSCDRGDTSRAEYDQIMSEITGLNVQTLEDKYWLSNSYNLQMLDLLDDLKKKQNYKIALLSNVNREWMDKILLEFKGRKLFDEMIISSDVRMIKPDQEIFELMISRLGLLPEECVMIDDRQENIDAAIKAGMQGIRYCSFEQMKIDLLNALEK